MANFVVVNKTEDLEKQMELAEKLFLFHSGVNRKTKPEEYGVKKIGNGKDGFVYESESKIIKVFTGMNRNDPILMRKVQGDEFFPVLYGFSSHRYMIVNKVLGETLKDKKEVTPDDFFEKYSKALRKLISLGYLLIDITEENIMIDEKRNPIFIDLGMYEKLGEPMTEQEIEGYIEATLEDLLPWL